MQDDLLGIREKTCKTVVCVTDGAVRAVFLSGCMQRSCRPTRAR